MVGWDGSKGNDCIEPVIEYGKKKDDKNKIINIQGNFTTQEMQYDFGLKKIQEYGQCDYIMLIDSDEIWDNENIERALNIIKMSGCMYNAYRCKMHTYIKDVKYRIYPPEPCMPTVFIKSRINKMYGIRGNMIFPSLLMYNVYFHHLTYVRKDYDSVYNKIKTSHIGDGLKHVNLEQWKKEKWDKLPDATNFHTTIGYEANWKSVKVLDESELSWIN